MLCTGHVLSRYLPAVLLEEQYIAALTIYSDRLASSVQQIYSTLVQLPSLAGHQKQFILNLAKLSSLQDMETIVFTGTSCNLETEEFDLEFIQSLNKASEEGSEEFKKPFLLLALQNGEKTVRNLVQAGSGNSGQVGTVSRVLHYLDPVCRRSKDGQTLLSSLLSKAILENRKATVISDILTCFVFKQISEVHVFQ